MFTRILVPTDFSRPSDAALAHARHMAGITGATVHLLHVVDDLFLRTILADSRDHEAAAMRQLQSRVPPEPGGPTTVLVVEHSEDPAAQITSYARAHDIDLIVIGTHGLTRLAHLLLGSVAEKVARAAPCAVLTVRDTLSLPVEGLDVLVPTDFSACADAALTCATSWAAEFGGAVRMLHVVENSARNTSLGSELFIAESPELQLDRIREARIELSRRILTAEPPRVIVAADVVEGPVAATIATYARCHAFGLVVMGTRGLGGVAHVLMGSIAESVIRTAPCPVLTVKSAKANQHRAASAAA
jgi:nucleotide-binding universal stress UspA family protein